MEYTVYNQVAPHAGAWIETLHYKTPFAYSQVAPHAGAWIETICAIELSAGTYVAPHAGAWIETLSDIIYKSKEEGRPSRGGVD